MRSAPTVSPRALVADWIRSKFVPSSSTRTAAYCSPSERWSVHTGIVVDLIVARRIAARQLLVRLELDARPLEIVVVVHIEAGLDFALEVPRMNVLGVRLHLLHRRDVRQLLVAVDRRVLAGRVGQHHRVVALRVPEVVADALLLHQAADEVEVGLPVLHAVGPLAVRPRSARA